MAPFMTLIFLLILAMVGFIFDLYLFSRGAFGNRYGKNTKFTRSPSTDAMMNDEDEYEFYVCSETNYDRSSRAHTVQVVLCAGVVILVLFLFMLLNSITL